MSKFKHTAYGAWLDENRVVRVGVIPADILAKDAGHVAHKLFAPSVYSGDEPLALTTTEIREAQDFRALLDRPEMKAMG